MKTLGSFKAPKGADITAALLAVSAEMGLVSAAQSTTFSENNKRFRQTKTPQKNKEVLILQSYWSILTGIAVLVDFKKYEMNNLQSSYCLTIRHQTATF